MTDRTEHPTREGKLSCCGVLDAHSRRVVGGSIDTHQAASLDSNARSMALTNRRPTTGTVIHSDHGTQFTCRNFTARARPAGLGLSMGAVGDGCDNAVIESFWGRLQTEFLTRQKWRTRIELSTSLFEYLEIFHNRTRRHSSFGTLTPVEYENPHQASATVTRLTFGRSGRGVQINVAGVSAPTCGNERHRSASAAKLRCRECDQAREPSSAETSATRPQSSERAPLFGDQRRIQGGGCPTGAWRKDRRPPCRRSWTKK